MNDQILDPETRDQMPDEMLAPVVATPWYQNWKIWVSVMTVIILLAGGVGYYLWSRDTAPKPISENVTLMIKGAEAVASGNETEFRVLYANHESADMLNVHIDVIYPAGFQFKSSTPKAKTASGQSFDLPMVKQGADAELVIRGKLLGSTGASKQIQAKLSYTLSNFVSTFRKEASITVDIIAPNLTFEIAGPVEVPVGQDTTFTLNYANVSGHDHENVALSVVYPEGYKFTAASLPPTKDNNYWQIGKLIAGSTGTLNITGSFSGRNFDEQILSGQLGLLISNNFAPQINSAATFKLKNAPITITQTTTPTDTASLGDNIQFTINYENSGSTGLTNVVITDTFVSGVIDNARLTVSDAIVVGNTITWKAGTNSNLSILSPGEKGQVQFNLPLKQNLPATIKHQVIKNSIIVSSAEVTTPIRAQDVELKLASKLGLSVTPEYVTGARPMTVGQSTTFAITLLLTSSNNDLNSTEVMASLPLPVSAWNNVIIPEVEKSRLHFDSNSGKIRWEVGNLSAFTGKLSQVAKVTFQLVVTPGVSDQNQIIKLLSDISASAFDSFTNQKLTATDIQQLTTSDIDDTQFQTVQ